MLCFVGSARGGPRDPTELEGELEVGMAAAQEGVQVVSNANSHGLSLSA
jgi:hypothetical protein